MQTFSSKATVDINAPMEHVWEALTKPEFVKQYFFGTNLETTWEVGSDIVFKGEWEGKPYEDRGTVLSFDAPHSLSFNYWSNFSGEPDFLEKRLIITYTVEAINEDSTRVTIEQTNTATQEKADHSSGNWKMVLDGMKKLIEG